jgi:phospholipase C
LDALTANPEVWAKTIFLLNFDENDGYFDHALNPAVPSYDINGELQGKTTMPTKGLYFDNSTRTYSAASYLSPSDTISGNLRPWGMGFRVPFYVVSPWSKGGWINSEVADHISIPLFLEKWLGITVPAISSWHRSVCSDLTSFFNFRTPNDEFPNLPDLSGFAASDAASETLPPVVPPPNQALPRQEPGFARSRALPYALHATASTGPSGTVTLEFVNAGKLGAVFHVYDRLNLNRIPRRYTVEAGKRLSDDFWDTNSPDYAAAAKGAYNLWVYGPNGFVRAFEGRIIQEGSLGLVHPEIELAYNAEQTGIHLKLRGNSSNPVEFTLADNAYGNTAPQTISVGSNETFKLFWAVKASGNWYDFSVKSENGFHRQFAGRMEDGKDQITDPQMGRSIALYTNPALG